MSQEAVAEKKKAVAERRWGWVQGMVMDQRLTPQARCLAVALMTRFRDARSDAVKDYSLAGIAQAMGEGWSRATVARHLRPLVDTGWLIEVHAGGGIAADGAGRLNVYRFGVPDAASTEPARSLSGETPSRRKSETPRGLKKPVQVSQICDTIPIVSPLDPSLTTFEKDHTASENDNKPKRKPSTRRTQVPEDWQPTEAGQRYAFDHGMRPDELPRFVEEFITWNRGHGRTYADFDHAWRYRVLQLERMGFLRSTGGARPQQQPRESLADRARRIAETTAPRRPAAGALDPQQSGRPRMTFADPATDAALAAFGEPLHLDPAGGPPTTRTGIFDSRHYAVEFEDGPPASSLTTTIAAKTSDLPGIAKGDALTARGVAYRVVDVRPDGQGMAVLVLEKIG